MSTGAAGRALWCGVLGPVEVRRGGEVLALGPKQRAIVAVLAIAGGPVPAADLVAAVWGEDADARSAHALQQQVSSIRKLVEPPRDDRGPATVLRTTAAGYELEATSDVETFHASRRAGEDAWRSGRAEEASDHLGTALGSWRGAALGDVRTIGDRLERVAAGLDEERMACTEAWAQAWIERDASSVVAELERLVGEHPWRERLRGQLMVALYRSGRQADALAAYAEGRRVLAEELGLEPGPELRQLEQQILVQDPALSAPSAEPGRGEVDALFATARAGSGEALALRLPDGQVVVMEGEVLIGRVPEAAVRLVDSRVSRRHAVIEATEAGWMVRDLGSTNGTRVNEVDAAGRPLVEGDVVDVGGVPLEVVRGAR